MIEVKAVLFGKKGGSIRGEDGMGRMKEDEAGKRNCRAKLRNRHGGAARASRGDDGGVKLEKSIRIGETSISN